MNWQDFLKEELLENSHGAIIRALVIFGLGYFLRRFISTAFSHFLYRLFKKFSKDAMHDEFVLLLVKPLQVLILLVSLYLAGLQLEYPSAWNLKPVHEHGLIMYVNRGFGAAICISIVWLVLRIVDFVMLVLLNRAAHANNRSDDQIIMFMKDIIKVAIGIFGLFFMLGAVFQLNITSLIAGLGIGGLAIALAAQETLSNLLGSFIIFLDKPFKTGDSISVENISGTIEHVGFRSTRIRTGDKSLLTVPNKKLVDSPLNNITASPYRRVGLTIGLTYQANASQIKKVVESIRALLMAHPELREDSHVNFLDFSPSSLDIVINYFVLTNDGDHLLTVREEINYQIMRIVEEQGCAFAYPTQTVYLEKPQPPADLALSKENL